MSYIWWALSPLGLWLIYSNMSYYSKSRTLMQNPGLTSSSFTNLIPTPTFKFKVVLIVNTPGVISMIDIRLIGWYCQKVNAQYPLNANHFMHTYKTTLKKTVYTYVFWINWSWETLILFSRHCICTWIANRLEFIPLAFVAYWRMLNLVEVIVVASSSLQIYATKKWLLRKFIAKVIMTLDKWVHMSTWML